VRRMDFGNPASLVLMPPFAERGKERPVVAKPGWRLSVLIFTRITDWKGKPAGTLRDSNGNLKPVA
jgi:hypothetical protein